MSFVETTTFPRPIGERPLEGVLDEPARKDHQHAIRLEDRRELDLKNGWTQANGYFHRTMDGVVLLYGRVNAGTVATGTVVATLPVGYRPRTDLRDLVLTNGGLAIGAILIQAGGDILIGALGVITSNIYFRSVFPANSQTYADERV